MEWRFSFRTLICTALMSSASYGAIVPDAANNAAKSTDQTADQFIVRWDDNMIRSSRIAPSGFSIKKTFKHMNNFEVVGVPAGKTMREALATYRNVPGVAYVEPDYVVHSLVTPNDPSYSDLWAMDNETNTDLNMPQAWDITTGSDNAVVAVIDSGIDYNHPDLTANVWQNPGEISGNGIDDDNNGYIDDVYGIDTANGDSDPFDDNEHGTHVAGTIAAEMNNSIGVVGVAPQTKVIACKFLNSYGSGNTSAAIECLDYLYDLKVNQGINIVATNNSWGGGGYSEILKEAIEQHNSADILFVAAAGNNGQNIDVNPSYPAAYDNTNIISVAAIDESDKIAYFSNYGVERVDIAAPGVSILSSTPNNGYRYFDGTSMAAPHVTGAVALVAALYPDESASYYQRLVTELGVDVPSLAGVVGNGQRLTVWGEDGSGPLNCEDKVFARLIDPVSSNDGIVVSPDDVIDFKVLVHNCGAPVLGQDYRALLDGAEIALLVDDGTGSDETANDGIYSASLTVNFLGEAELSFTGDIDNEFTIISREVPTIVEVPYSYIDFEGSPMELGLDEFKQLDVDLSVQWPMGQVEKIFVSDHGFISADEGVLQWFNSSLPFSDDLHAIMPFWDDLNPNGGDVYYAVFGEAPNRQLVIEWRDYSFYGFLTEDPEDKIEFQVVMNESTPEILINYKDVEAPANSFGSNGGSATIGYEFSGDAVELSYNQSSISNESSYRVSLPSTEGYPEISKLNATGILRPGYPIVIDVEGSAPEEGADIELSIDYGDGESFDIEGDTASLTHTFLEAGTYSVVVVADSNGKQVFRTLYVEIQALSSLEQALIDAEEQRVTDAILTDPELYGLATQESLTNALATATENILGSLDEYGLATQVALEAAVAQASLESEELVKNFPDQYGLIDADTLTFVNAKTVSELAAGTHLLGSSVAITDLQAVFSDARLVWVYVGENTFAGWSPDAQLNEQILNSGYQPLQTIEAGAGFWVKK